MLARLESRFIIVAMLGMLISSTAPAGDPCQFPDLSDVEPVQMMPGAVEPSGNGGDIPGGRWELVRLLYSFAIDLQGEAIGAIEMDAVATQSGVASLALNVTITSPVAESIEEEGAGPYIANDNELSFKNECGEETLLGEVEYDIDQTGDAPVMTVWGSTSFAVSPLPPTTVLLQAEFELVEPQTVEDPIFDDRFQETENP